MKKAIGIGVAVIILIGLLAYEFASWAHCLSANPWWYCFRLLW
jgi:hypothetical protein